MTTKLVRMGRLDRDPSPRPMALAIAGDSASGKTTLAKGIVDAIGPERCTSICVDDYHRLDRDTRRATGTTPLNPEANYMDILEQHMQLLALGRPILKPVYDHATGTLATPEYVAPREFLIIEGLHALSTPLIRACLDISVYLDPDESLRTEWKVARDVERRGYTEEEVRSELAARVSDVANYISPQRSNADIVVRFAPSNSTDRATPGPLSAEVLLRPTVRHPDFAGELSDAFSAAMTLEIVRDDGNPTDLLRLRGDALSSEYEQLEKRIWNSLGGSGEVPDVLGRSGSVHSSSLALTQLILMHHLLR